jgi:hypothetical protein
MKILIVALLLIGLAACTGPLAKLTNDQLAGLTADQIHALDQAGTAVRACLQINGPPPAGSGTIMIVPKSDTAPVNFGNDCHPIPPPIPPVILQVPVGSTPVAPAPVPAK